MPPLTDRFPCDALPLFCVKRMQNTRNDAIFVSLFQAYERAAEVVSMTARGVRQLAQRSAVSRPTPPKSSTSPPTVDNFTIGAVRRYIHSKFAAKELLAIKRMTADLTSRTFLRNICLEALTQHGIPVQDVKKENVR